MGVSLERVQNKFACIIGELCSEPIVLSQFAVWVDLRIAEYKTNGTISLDCSGDSPNPIWMKGVKTAPQRGSSNSMDTGQGHHRRRGSYTNSPSLQSPSASPLSNQMYNERLPSADNQNSSSVFPSRLSPEIVVIKEEPSSDPSSCSLSRKRQSEGDLQSDYYSPAKSRRHGNASFSSPAQESSSNQSLMSIINTETDTITVEPVKNEDDIFKVTMEMQDELNQSQGLPPITSSNSTFSPRRPSATATSTSNSPNQSAWPTSYVNDPQQGTSSQAETEMDEAQTSHQASRDQILRALYPDISIQHNLIVNSTSGQDSGTFYGEGQIPSQTGASSSRLANGATKTFKRWLTDNKGMPDSAKLEDVAPEDIDAYLTEFLTTIRKQDGSDYRPNSLRSLRQGIDFYLKDHGYPHSIVGSPQFTRSQLAYKARMNELLAVTSSHFTSPQKLSLSLCQNTSDTSNRDEPM